LSGGKNGPVGTQRLTGLFFALQWEIISEIRQFRPDFSLCYGIKMPKV
jgi:hypothetical protein